MYRNIKTVLFASSALLMTKVDATWSWGSCPENSAYELQKDLDLKAFEGMWYEILRDPWMPVEWATACVTDTNFL